MNPKSREIFLRLSRISIAIGVVLAIVSVFCITQNLGPGWIFVLVLSAVLVVGWTVAMIDLLRWRLPASPQESDLPWEDRRNDDTSPMKGRSAAAPQIHVNDGHGS
ncbi:hypothetical protein [Herbiconiux sp.]|uniref:hypothetical protein n=1 Tax=Herbiconiux sp. TaxID=1871186 RepID=UPI0025C260B6|nr:hypothetical protein [Herbiconiux sp.]